MTGRIYLHCIVVGYAAYMVFAIVSCMSLKRHVLLVKRQEFGVAIINGVKYRVPFRDERTMPTFDVENPIDFLFLSDKESCECLTSSIVKLFITVVFEILLLKFDSTDPLNEWHIKYYRLLIGALIALLFSEFFKYMFTNNWVSTFKGGLDGYQYGSEANFITIIIVIAILDIVIAAYKKAIQNQKELELTI
jgi:hypothetical protein